MASRVRACSAFWKCSNMARLYGSLLLKTLPLLLIFEGTCLAMKTTSQPCHALKTAEGNFQYLFDARDAEELEFTLTDKTVIARWNKSKDPDCGQCQWVKAVDETSITLYQCLNLTITKFLPHGKEITFSYRVTEDHSLVPEQPHSFPVSGIVLIVIVVVVVAALLVAALLYVLKKPRQEDVERGDGEAVQDQHELEPWVSNNASETPGANDAPGPQDDPPPAPSKEESHPEHSHSNGVCVTSDPGKRQDKQLW